MKGALGIIFVALTGCVAAGCTVTVPPPKAAAPVRGTPLESRRSSPRSRSCEDRPGGLAELRLFRTYVELQKVSKMPHGYGIDLRELIPLPDNGPYNSGWRRAYVDHVHIETDGQFSKPWLRSRFAGVESREKLSPPRPRRWLNLPTEHGGRWYLGQPLAAAVKQAIVVAARRDNDLSPGTSLGKLQCRDSGAVWPVVHEKLRYSIDLAGPVVSTPGLACCARSGGALDFEFDVQKLYRHGSLRSAAHDKVGKAEATGIALITLAQDGRRDAGAVRAELELDLTVDGVPLRRVFELKGEAAFHGDQVFVFALDAPVKQSVGGAPNCPDAADVDKVHDITMRMCAGVVPVWK